MVVTTAEIGKVEFIDDISTIQEGFKISHLFITPKEINEKL